MSAIHWSNAVNGNFNDKGNWTPNQVPDSTADAVLDATGGNYTVLAQSGLIGLFTVPNQVVSTIDTSSNATLSVLGGLDALDLLHSDTKFTALNGTGAGRNAGTILVRNNIITGPLGQLLSTTATLDIGGMFNNTGLISIDEQPKVLGILDADQRARLEITGATTLTGGGSVTLSDERENIIYGHDTSSVLTNVDNTISGAGFLGNGLLTIHNETSGVIDAIGHNGLVVHSNQVITNAGVLEASGRGVLTLARSTIDDSAGGIIEASGGSRVVLKKDFIEGGTLRTAGTGYVVAGAANTTLDGIDNPVTMIGQTRVHNGAALTLKGAIDNTGLIRVAATGQDPRLLSLIIGAQGATLSGGGKINTTNSGELHIVGATKSATLNNLNNRISGGGQLGGGEMKLTNGASGRIESTDAVNLTIDTGSNVISNEGAIAAYGSGGITINSGLLNSGVLSAHGGNIVLNGAVTGAGLARIDGGTLDAEHSFTENVVFTGMSGTLQLQQSTGYSGTIWGFSHTGATLLDLGDIAFGADTKASYAGSATKGVLTVTDGTNTASIKLAGDYIGATFTATSDGHGGTKIVDPTVGAAGHSAFVSAMSSFGASSAALISSPSSLSASQRPMLATASHTG